MWTRSAKDKTTGLIEVKCIDWNGAVFFAGSFADLVEAETAGQDAERRMTSAMMTSGVECDLLNEMTDDELLAELLG